MPVSKGTLPVESYRTHLIFQQQLITTHVKCCLSGKMPWPRSHRVFTRSYPHRYTLPRICQNSRLPEGKQVFSTCPMGTVGPFPKSRLSDVSQGSALEADISKGSCLRFALLGLFCTASQIDWRKDDISSLLKFINISLPAHLSFPPRKRSL